MPQVSHAEPKKQFAGEGVGSHKQNLPGGATQFYIPNLTTDMVYSWKTISLANM